MDYMTNVDGLNWATFWAFAGLMALCVVVGWRREKLRSWAIVLFMWAADNWLLYAALLFWPDWMTPLHFAIWSAASKLHAVSSAVIGLLWATWPVKR